MVEPCCSLSRRGKAAIKAVRPVAPTTATITSANMDISKAQKATKLQQIRREASTR